MQVIHHLAQRMKDFHALGYVHRDLKPANVMWLPRENRWTIIDFGCVARTGEAARQGFSVRYAAPEVIAAFRAKSPRMPATLRPYSMTASVHCASLLHRMYQDVTIWPVCIESPLSPL